MINEEPKLYDNLQLASGNTENVGSSIEIIDSSHFITSVFPPGGLSIYTGGMEILTADTPLAAGLQTLAEFNGAASLTAIDIGDQTIGGTAAGRRVTLPFGQHFAAGFDWKNLNQNGHLLVHRAIEWAMGDASDTHRILLVVGISDSLQARDTGRRDLFESWGHQVTIIDDGATQAEFDAELALNDVVYVGGTVVDGNLAAKLSTTALGVVNEVGGQLDDLGFHGNATANTVSSNKFTVTDAAHYITEIFAGGPVTHFTTFLTMPVATEPLAQGLSEVADAGITTGAVASLATGVERWDGEPSPGRRVHLPFGEARVDQLTDDGTTLLRRSLDWAAGAGAKYGLIAHWKLDEGTGVVAVDSVGGHDGTLLNGPVWTGGAINGGVQFSDTTQAIAVNDAETLSITGDLTLAAWIYPDALQQSRSIVMKGKNNVDLNYFMGLSINGVIQFAMSPEGGGWSNVTSGPTSISPGSWYHVAVTYDDANNLARFYIDGVEVMQKTTTHGPSVFDGVVRIGRSNTGYGFPGRLDDVRIYRDLLDASEIAELAERPPIAHWKMDEGAGTTAVDSAGGHDGTLVNDPSWVFFGKIGGALDFDGSNDVVIAPHDPALSLTQALTFTAWVYSTDLNMYDLVIGKGNNSSTYAYFFGTSGDEIVFGFDDTAFHSFETPNLNLATDTWHHIAATFSGPDDSVRLYHNGVEVHSDSTTFDPPVNTHDLWIGSSENGADWNGMLDDVRIYDRALNASEISEIAGNNGGPIAHWKLDDGTGLTAIDSEGGHDGTLTNGPVWVVGQLGDALRFDNSDDYVDLTSDAELGDVFDGGATVMAWIYPTGWGENGYGRILDKSSSASSTGDGWAIRMNTDNSGVINFGQGFASGRGWWKVQNGSVTLNTWQHVAIVYDASNTANDPAIYLNGSSTPVIRVDAPSGDIRSDAAINLRLGNFAGGTSHTFDGTIDDVRIYDSMLSATEIADLAASGGSGGGGWRRWRRSRTRLRDLCTRGRAEQYGIVEHP